MNVHGRVELLEFDHHQISGVLRGAARLCHHHGDRFADMHHTLAGERGMKRQG